MWKNLGRKKISINFKTRLTAALCADKVTHSQVNLNQEAKQANNLSKKPI
jgi:hypothetical protein